MKYVALVVLVFILVCIGWFTTNITYSGHYVDTITGEVGNKILTQKEWDLKWGEFCKDGVCLGSYTNSGGEVIRYRKDEDKWVVLYNKDIKVLNYEEVLND